MSRAYLELLVIHMGGSLLAGRAALMFGLLILACCRIARLGAAVLTRRG